MLLLTQNFRSPMALADLWTPFMAIWPAGNVILLLETRSSARKNNAG